MKHIHKRMAVKFGFCFSLLLALTLSTQARAEEYYIYRDANGKLILSNQQPPPGSTIIKQQNLPETLDNEVPRVQEHADTFKDRPENSPETPKNK